jgi:hypothetical protein
MILRRALATALATLIALPSLAVAQPGAVPVQDPPSGPGLGPQNPQAPQTPLLGSGAPLSETERDALRDVEAEWKRYVGKADEHHRRMRDLLLRSFDDKTRELEARYAKRIADAESRRKNKHADTIALTLRADAGGPQHPGLRSRKRTQERRIHGPGLADGFESGPVGRQPVEATHHHLEQGVAGRLLRRPLRGARQHLVIHRAHEGCENVRLAAEIAAQVHEAHTGGLSNVGERHVPPGALTRQTQRCCDETAFGRGRIEHGGLLALNANEVGIDSADWKARGAHELGQRHWVSRLLKHFTRSRECGGLDIAKCVTVYHN